MKLTNSLIENGARLTLKDRTNGCYPLHYACALLKHEQIEFYLKQLTMSPTNLRDLNGNTPLVYLMVAFAYYLNYNRLYLISASSTPSSRSSTRRRDLVSPLNNHQNDDIQTDSIDMFQAKIIDVLKLYIRIIKHESSFLNVKNRHGLSLEILCDHLVDAYPNLNSNEFFQIIKSELLEESFRESTHQFNRTIDVEKTKKPVSSTQLKFRDITNRPNRHKVVSISNINMSKLYDPLHDEEMIRKSPRINIDTFLKTHLLIDLNEMRTTKTIGHSKKLDKNLLNIFTNRNSSNEKVEISNLISKEQAPARSVNSLQSKEMNTTKVNESWRDTISQMLSDSIEDTCDSYRRGIKLTYDFSKIFLSQFQANKKETMTTRKSSQAKTNGPTFKRRESNLSTASQKSRQ